MNFSGGQSSAFSQSINKVTGFAKRSSVAILLGITAVSAMPAQPAVAQAYAFNSVEVIGAQRIETATILNYLGINRGETISAGALNDGYQRLIGSGLFETVEILPQGSKLVVKVQEYPTVNVVSVEGNKRLKDEVFAPLLKTVPRYVYSPSTAEQDAKTIIEVYQAQGRLAATVTPKIIRRPNNRVDVVFEVVEGKTVEVERLSFVGNRAFSDRRLRRVLQTKQAGILRQFVRADSYVPERIEFDKRVLTDFYQSRGYVDFKVLNATSQFSRERDAFFVTFNVQEGQQFRIGEITASTDQPGIDSDEFLAVSKLRSGVVYSPRLIENTISRMERLALGNGLNFIRVEPVITRDPRNLLLNIDFRVTRGPRVVVERIDIEGNATTLDRVVRSQFRIAEGDPFNPREIREAAERVRALGFFSDAQVNTREGSSPDRVVVDVDLEEGPTGSLSFGGAYSLENGFGLNISYAQRNFLGRGQFLKLAFSNTSDTTTFAFDFAEPRFLGRDLRFGLSAFYTESEQASSFFDSRKIGFRPSLEFPISENGRLGVRAFVDGSEMLNVNDKSSPILVAEGARGNQTGVGAGLTYSLDTRRTGLNPNAGVLLRLNADVGGFGADYQYVKAEALARAQTKVLNDQVTLSATFEGGMLQSLNNGVSRFTDRFHLGPSKLRGFATNGLGPRDLESENNDALGGNYYAVARLEAQFPLGIPEEYGITGGLFIDAGTLWGLDNTAGANNTAVDDGAKLRSSIGASIFWDTPIGPLRLNYSHAIAKEEFDKVNEFELTISSQF